MDVLVSCPSLLGMSVERKLAPTLAFLLAHFPDAPAPILFRAGTFSLRGHVAPRVFLLAESGAIHRWAPGTFLAWNVGTFCEKAGVSREAYDAKVRSCKREELDVTLPVPNDATLGGFFTKEKISVHSETAGRDETETETETETDASADPFGDPRARARAAARRGATGGPPRRSARARVAPRSAEPMPRRMSSYDTRIVLLMVRFMHTGYLTVSYHLPLGVVTSRRDSRRTR